MEIHTLDRKQSRCDLIDYHLLQRSTFLVPLPFQRVRKVGFGEGRRGGEHVSFFSDSDRRCVPAAGMDAKIVEASHHARASSPQRASVRLRFVECLQRIAKANPFFCACILASIIVNSGL